MRAPRIKITTAGLQFLIPFGDGSLMFNLGLPSLSSKSMVHLPSKQVHNLIYSPSRTCFEAQTIEEMIEYFSFMFLVNYLHMKGPQDGDPIS